jgi:putative Mg2+ transporter-C (MgtC) family protein
MMVEDLNIVFRLFVALLLAGLLGWERESAGKAAGIRTHMLVGIGAAMFVVLGELFVLRYAEFGQLMRFDPTRVIEAVVTGISFLGAGTIFVARARGEQVMGLTTAASILVTAAIGMIVALERYLLAITVAALVFGVLHVMRTFEKRVFPEVDKNVRD